MEQYGIVILAAGSSSRFGSPKQIVEYNRQTLIQHAISEAGNVEGNLVVVLGAHYRAVKNKIGHLHVKTVLNKNWKEGMASSVRCGLSYLLKECPNLDAVLIMVIDQPFVSSALLRGLIGKYHETKKLIVASSYKNTLGTPALFNRIYFPELMSLRGRYGAKKIISKYPDSTVALPFPDGHIDINTREQFDALQKNQFN
jgi:molybdenum cofactor cytidylyltransferase